MDDVTVACSCGRTMTPAALAGRGAFRCGCGNRVTVAVARKAACTWLLDMDEACTSAPVREAAEVELSLCEQHFARHKELLIEYGHASEAIEILARWEDEDAHREHRADLDRRYAEQSVVYYVRMRDLVKIGTTINMERRSAGLLWDELLATEPGGRDLEQMRHKQFRHLRVRGERFEPGPDLMSHIAMIREHFGEPRMTRSLEYIEPSMPLLARAFRASGEDQSRLP